MKRILRGIVEVVQRLSKLVAFVAPFSCNLVHGVEGTTNLLEPCKRHVFLRPPFRTLQRLVL